MAIEQARIEGVRKPWGNADLRPWSAMDHDGSAIGELWFHRSDRTAPAPALLLKLLFTTKPLSIQVHPDDTLARSLGFEHGKDEAWYILSATPDAKIAVGLERPLAEAQLRAAIEDGSISRLVHWQPVMPDEVIFVPAGTIHTIGAGLVIAEIQQRSDMTFRLFDYGRSRELHVENAVAAAIAGPARSPAPTRRLGDARALLLASPHFVLERIDLSPNSAWQLHAERETWLFVLAGRGQVGTRGAARGEAFFLDADTATVEVGSEGLKALLAYPGSQPDPDLLLRLGRRTPVSSGAPVEARA